MNIATTDLKVNPDSEAEQLAEAIFAYISEHRNVSFAELAREWPKHFGRGEYQIMSGTAGIVLWNGVDLVGGKAFAILKPRLEIDPCSPIVYLIDGRAPALPIVKVARAYKRPHWLPVVLNAKR